MEARAEQQVAYCGAPPVPGAVGWNLDPVLWAFLAAVLLVQRLSSRGAAPARRRVFLAGWAVAALALVSPLCQLGVALFAARVAQHLLLVLVAAPLVAASLGTRARGPRLQGPAVAAPAFAAALWAWHLPGPYDATLVSTPLYWLMHATLFGTALWLWRGLLDPARPHLAATAGLATAAQMGMLGAVLTLAPAPLFRAHEATTWPWGLTPLEDQQLGGLLMWVPGGLLLTAGGLLAFGLWLRSLERRPSDTPAP